MAQPQHSVFEQESAICTSARESYYGAKKERKGLWPNGKIYYKIGDFKKHWLFGTSKLLYKVQQAISEWNYTNRPYCEFVEINEEKRYYVIFQQTCDDTPNSHVGCRFGDFQQEINLPEKYSNGSEVRIACILHEMMHCAGFEHEHSRKDRHYHCEITSSDPNFDTNEVVQLGQYDYYSLMHYGEVDGMRFENEELRRLADKSPTFSAGDRAAIKLMYSSKGTHHGEWHKPCNPLTCTDKGCACGNCGPLKGGMNCGYWGNKGHWTCCMDEDENSKCKITHTGFWHAQCIYEECDEKLCSCGNCGGGCTYNGSKAHWNCCNQEDFESECKQKFKKILYEEALLYHLLD